MSTNTPKNTLSGPERALPSFETKVLGLTRKIDWMVRNDRDLDEIAQTLRVRQDTANDANRAQWLDAWDRVLSDLG